MEGRGVDSPVRLLPEIRDAIREQRPVVALESSVFAQGLPIPANRDAAKRMTSAVRSHGAVPAVTGIVAGVPCVGLSDDEIDCFLSRAGVDKVTARDLPAAMIMGANGATTVAAAMALATLAGIDVFATGGIGGVHRADDIGATVRDESADLHELATTSMIVVCAGAKSILDLPATWERLETLGIPVVGYRTDELPAFFTAHSGIRLSVRVESPESVAGMFVAHRALARRSALLVVQRPPADVALEAASVERAVDRAIARARSEGVRGSAVTPYLLAEVEKATGGASLAANLGLLEANAALASEIAVTLSRLTEGAAGH